MTRHPVLRPGDTLRLGGQTHTVAGLDSVTVRLADVTGAVIEVTTAGLLADPSLELVTGSRVPQAPQPLDRLPAETVENARWWERHLIEVITGVQPGSPPGTRPRPEYDPARRSLRQRELAKHGELTQAGHRVGLSTLKRLRARYERDGLWGVIDHRAARRTARPVMSIPGWWRPPGRPSPRRPTARPARCCGWRAALTDVAAALIAFAAALIAVAAAAAPSGLWWPAAALLATAAAVTTGYALSRQAGRRRLRADPAFRTQELLIGHLWEMTRRLPAGAILTDPATSRALVAERDCGFLTLVVTDPPAGPGVPTEIAILHRYAIGFARWPTRPPLMHDIAPAKVTPAACRGGRPARPPIWPSRPAPATPTSASSPRWLPGSTGPSSPPGGMTTGRRPATAAAGVLVPRGPGRRPRSGVRARPR